MASRMYGKGAQKLLNKQIDMDTDDIRAVLLSNVYTPDLDVHEFYSDLSGVLGTPIALTSKSITLGIFDADDITYPTIAAGSTGKGVALYVHNADPAAAALVAWIDNFLGFPFATTGGNVPIQWSNGARKIFSLVG